MGTSGKCGESTFGKPLSCPPLAKGEKGGFYKKMRSYNNDLKEFSDNS